jgi:hypothetical protein
MSLVSSKWLDIQMRSQAHNTSIVELVQRWRNGWITRFREGRYRIEGKVSGNVS